MFLYLARSASKMCLTFFLESEKASLDYKKRELKRSKNHDFSKGVSPYGFGEQFEIFPCFPFWQKNSQQNVFDDIPDILESKKAILNLVHVKTV